MLSIHIAGGWLFAMRRVLATLGIGLLAAFIAYKAVAGPNGMRVWQAKRTEAQRLQQEIDAATTVHEQLEREVNRLQQADPSAIEKEARERLGLVRPGEYVLYEPAPKTETRQFPENTARK